MTISWAESNPCELIRLANLTTIGKKPKDGWTPTKEWARKQVLAEHSSLEFASLIIQGDIRGDVVNQLVRATAYHPRHEVQSSRPDWTNKPRPSPETLRGYMGKWDVKALLQMSKERLCNHAMKETREEVERLKLYLLKADDIFMNAVGWSMIPQCIYRGACPFLRNPCGWFESDWADGWSSLDERYDLYNDWFLKKYKI